MTNQAVANEILKQLGGNKFLAMTGSVAVGYDEQSITFKLKKNESKANTLKITLTPMDEYKMEFGKLNSRTYETKSIKEYDGIYFDQLQELFTKVTGMYTRL